METTDATARNAPAAAATTTTTTDKETLVLPANRFALELEFLQALASPNYLHFLATCKTGGQEYIGGQEGETDAGGLLLQDPGFRAFLRYLQRTWTQPEYARFVSYPHAFFFLEVLLNDTSGTVAKEWTLPAFRNFCHQQQFLAWQHRHAQLYGAGTTPSEVDGEAPP